MLCNPALQPVSVAVAQEGLNFRWEDEAKTLQSSVFLRAQVRGWPPVGCGPLGGRRTELVARRPPSAQACQSPLFPPTRACPNAALFHPPVRAQMQLFSTYECPSASETFGVNFSQLVDTLNVFASGSDEQLHLRYPGPNGELQLE